MFDNLINNAIKYGSDGKRVLVGIHATDTVVTVSVTNYGYVIPAAELPLIFDKFYRVEQSRSTNTGGDVYKRQSILVMAKRLAERQGTDRVTAAQFGEFHDRILKMSTDEIEEAYELSTEYAAMMIPGAIIYKRMIDLIGAETCLLYTSLVIRCLQYS